MLYLNDEFKQRFAGGDPYKMLAAMEGKIYRQLEGRKTFQFSLNGNSYFVKLHSGVGWGEIVKNLLQLRWPIISAHNEWKAINRLQQLGVDTMVAVAYGRRGLNPARQQSFIITEALLGTTSLEDYCRDWPIRPPPLALKRALIDRIAAISRTLHTNGVCHRDYYLCHFLLHEESIQAPGGPRLSLIDLHRALCADRLRERWVLKDLAGLWYSAMDIGLSRRDLFRFMTRYDGTSLREAMTARGDFWRAVAARADAMTRKLGPSVEQ